MQAGESELKDVCSEGRARILFYEFWTSLLWNYTTRLHGASERLAHS